jgi:hypothetical protein
MRGVEPVLQFYAEHLIAYANALGLGARLTSGRRSRAEQARLYQRYISGLSALPAAPPGTSKHEYGQAVDITANSLDGLNWMGKVWRAWGGTWGGSSDPVHFEI